VRVVVHFHYFLPAERRFTPLTKNLAWMIDLRLA
jgi:hypothetical protein